MRVYYAHPLSLYNTKQEDRDMETLMAIFGQYHVYNPNNEDISARYQVQNYNMEVFFDEIKECDVLAFRSLPFGKITAGVAAEIKFAQEGNLFIIELPNFTDRNLSIEDTRTYLKEVGFR